MPNTKRQATNPSRRMWKLERSQGNGGLVEYLDVPALLNGFGVNVSPLIP